MAFCQHETIYWDATAPHGFRPIRTCRAVAVNGGRFCTTHARSAPPGPSRVVQGRKGPFVLGVDPAGGPVVKAEWRGPGYPVVTWIDEAWELGRLGPKASRGVVDYEAPNREKESTMSTAERLRIEAEKLLERAAKIDALPKEPSKGRYFALDVKFRTGPTVYKYLIVRPKPFAALWFSTGRDGARGAEWANLINWGDVESAKLTRLRKEK